MDDFDREDYEQTLKDFNDDTNDELKMSVLQAYKNEKTIKEPLPPTFRPIHFMCTNCWQEIFSTFPWHLVQCSCKQSSVCQTDYRFSITWDPIRLYMRDPWRIPYCINIIQDIWKQFPDLRFGQLLLNFAWYDLYYMEDKRLFESISLFYNDLVYEQNNTESVSWEVWITNESNAWYNKT